MAPHREIPRITTLDAQGRPIDDDPTNTIEDDIAKQLDDIIAEFGQSETDVTWQVVVTRAAGPYMKTGGKEPYLFSCDPSEIGGIRDRLRDEYGEGTYRIRVRKNGRNHRQFDYTIEAPIKQKTDAGDGVTRALLDRMDRMEARSNDILQQLITATRSGSALPMAVDPIAMFEKFATIMAAMNGAVRQQTGPDPMDLMTKTFDMAARLVDLRGDSNNGPGETNIYDILKEAVKNPGLVEAITPKTAQLPQRVNTVRPFNPPPQQQPQPVRNDAGATVTGVDDFGSVIPYLNTCAARGANVEFYCDWVFDNATPEQLNTLINHPSILDFLATRYPGMVPYRPWYDRLLAEMRAAAQDGANADVDDEGTSASQTLHERADGGTAAPQGETHARSNLFDKLTGQPRDMGHPQNNGPTNTQGKT